MTPGERVGGAGQRQRGGPGGFVGWGGVGGSGGGGSGPWAAKLRLKARSSRSLCPLTKSSAGPQLQLGRDLEVKGRNIGAAVPGGWLLR